ncbi:MULTISPECIES: ABC transporter permease subunit [Actinomadura]|uniref:ABC transporter permease subunit n=1 Tax=Actinomadura yumaensis TaxID=111807 RepID=A0ABW2CKW4_9ACTN|nr:ABC transporter permease subunit [Actinomadura sp. J1-007]MWK40286.1 ABC transporter permease subunit [Actinomadura sp. J1-007]
MRSAYWTVAVAVAFVPLSVLLAMQAAHIWDGLSAERREGFGLASLADLAAWAAALCLGVLGVLSVTSEYRTGMIRVTLAAVPARRTVLAAKAAVVAAVALAAGEAVAFTTFLATRGVIGDRPISGYTSAFGDEAVELAAAGASVAAFALFGVGLAFVLRSTAGSIVSLALVWHVVPVMVGNLPAPWNDRIGSFMLGGLPAQIGRKDQNSIYGELLPPGAAALVLLAYAVVPLAAAAIVLTRRDA